MSVVVQDKVRLGIAWLDEHVQGWRERIDPDRLDLKSQWNCVLAQVNGSGYDEACEDFHLSLESRVSLGFTIYDDSPFGTPDYFEDRRRKWEELTQTWLEELGFES